MLVKFNKQRVLCFQDKKIIPGINELPEEFVAEMMEDSILAGKFDSGELEVIGRDDIGAGKVKASPGKEPSAVIVLSAASEKNAIKLAGETVDIAILEEWLLKEKRVPVRKALRAQIAKIKNIKFRDKNETKFEKAKEE